MRRNSRSLAALGVAAVLLVAGPTLAQVRDHRELRYPPLPAFEIPKPQTFTLKNGLTVFLMEDRELPLVSAEVRIRTGSLYEPAEKAGLASITGTVLRTGGTRSMSPDQVDEFLENRAASIETSIGSDSGFASMNCLAEDFDEVFQLFVEILRSPAFAQDRIDLAKVQASAAIARRNDSINAITAREFSRLVYGADTPLGRLTQHATIAAITRDDLVAWHARYVHPNNMLLGLVGDFDAKQMRKRVEKAFADWPKGPNFSATEPGYRKQPNPGVFFIEKSDVTQANIVMGHLGITVRDPDYFAAQVLNEVLGGSFAARLFSNVRSKKGLAYNVYGGIGSSFLHPGLTRVGCQTKSSTMSEAVAALKEELVGMIERPPDDAELARAKESILNSFVFNYDSKREVLSQQLLYAYYGLPLDFLERYRANIEKVTREDVARVARTHIHPDRLTLLVVGKSSDFDKPLGTLGQVVEVDITIPPPPESTPKLEKTAEGAAAGRALLGKVAGALGGRDPKGIRAVELEGTLAFHLDGQPGGAMKRTVLLALPDRMRDVRVTPMGEVTIVVTPEEGFARMRGRTVPLPAAQLEEARRDALADLQVLVRYHDDPGLEAVAGEEEQVEGVRCRLLAVSFRGSSATLCVAEDGHVLREARPGTDPTTGVPASIEALYADYREVDGRRFPFSQRIRIGGREVATFTLDSVRVNPQVDESVFRRPEE